MLWGIDIKTIDIVRILWVKDVQFEGFEILLGGEINVDTLSSF